MKHLVRVNATPNSAKREQCPEKNFRNGASKDVREEDPCDQMAWAVHYEHQIDDVCERESEKQ